MDLHTGGRWSTYGTKHRKENQLPILTSLLSKNSVAGEKHLMDVHKYRTSISFIAYWDW